MKRQPRVNGWWLLSAFWALSVATQTPHIWLAALCWLAVGVFAMLFEISIQRAIDHRKDRP